MNPMDPDLSAGIRAAMRSTDKPLALGWDLLRKAKAHSRANLTGKELFLAGAGYVFDAIVYAMTEGSEPTAEDMELLTKIHNELKGFHEHFNRKLMP